MLLALVVTGCGQAGAPVAGPSPGTMQVVRTEPLHFEAPPLMANGDMRNGGPAPRAQRLCRAEDRFVRRQHARRRPRRRGATLGHVDHDTGLDTQFRTEVAGLTAGRRYRLEVLAAADPGTSASISLWEQVPGEDATPLTSDFIVLPPGQGYIKQFAKSFIAKKDGAVVIASHANEITPVDGAVRWYRWSLKPENTE